MKTESESKISRRKFIHSSLNAAVLSSMAFPSIVPARVLGKNAPGNRINIGAIGNGRISRIHDLPGVWKYDYAQVIAVCDLDTRRATDGKALVNDYYTKKYGKPFDGVSVCHDYREVIRNKDIDAVLISTPDHTHAMICIAAARAGKHIYMQKPASLTSSKGRIGSEIVRQ